MPEAKLTVTIDLFSGRPNPVLEFTGRKLQDVLKRLDPGPKARRREPGLPTIPTLGYRGLEIRLTGAKLRGLPNSFRVADGLALGPDFAVPIADDAFEDFICGTKHPELPPLKPWLEDFRELLDFWRRNRWPPEIVWPRWPRCRCAPLYEPGVWNVSPIQWKNNCYNYGTNYRTDTYAQPGMAATGQHNQVMTCAVVRPLAIQDGLEDAPGANNKCPGEGHLVALVVSPNSDYHWYRKGRDGMWSHKMGGSPATNLDNSSQPITDPRTANRGSYTDFCTFMIVKHGHFRLKGPY